MRGTGSWGLSLPFLAHSASQRCDHSPPAACCTLQRQPSPAWGETRVGVGRGGGEVHFATSMKPTTEPVDFSSCRCLPAWSPQMSCPLPCRGAAPPPRHPKAFCGFHRLLLAFRARRWPRGVFPCCPLSQGEPCPPAHVGIPCPFCSGGVWFISQPQSLSHPDAQCSRPQDAHPVWSEHRWGPGDCWCPQGECQRH